MIILLSYKLQIYLTQRLEKAIASLLTLFSYFGKEIYEA